MAGLIDKEAEFKRLGKEIEKLQKDIDRIQGKLGNSNFTAKAPAEVVEKEQEKLNSQQQALATLQAQMQRIQTM